MKRVTKTMFSFKCIFPENFPKIAGNFPDIFRKKYEIFRKIFRLYIITIVAGYLWQASGACHLLVASG